MLHLFLLKIQNWFLRIFGYVLSMGANLERADKFIANGDFPRAIAEIQKYLKRDPHNCQLMLALSNCYEQLGNKPLSRHYAEVAYTLNDTYIVAIFHWARALIDCNRCEEALPLFALIKDNTPFAEGVNSALSGICMSLGDAYRAKEFQMTAWLSDFDDLRNANCYLFRLAYNDSDELLLAQEHQFWAETLKPKAVASSSETANADKVRLSQTKSSKSPPAARSNKIRIGYWGCDFHEHSVRYFSRPLIGNHDPDRFEVFIFSEDAIQAAACPQARAFRAMRAEFHEVFKLNDQEFVAFILSHDLDILVDLTGHTSNNRLHLLRNKLAKVQITGLAYPPTTGHKSIDVKMVDVHIWTPDADLYYAEDPLVMPESLWCFDPMEEVPYTAHPPMLKNGYVTFGCFGNVAKITPPVLACWSSILNRLPSCRLLIQSTVLVDVTTSTAFRKRLTDAGIDEAQVDLRGPCFGTAFWETYQNVDIVLDTYPFNGGTTSCFATYVGVPLITWSGQSLISRVGRSIMFNLGYPHFVVNSPQDYVERAIETANDAALITAFRRDAPQRFKTSSLGNGPKFTTEFEAECVKLLERYRRGELQNHSRVPPLPADVLLQRAQIVWYNGNFDAANRIVELCLRNYPDCGGAHLFNARQCVDDKRHSDALALLNEHFASFKGVDLHESFLLLARVQLMMDDKESAAQALKGEALCGGATRTHGLQAELLKTALVLPNECSANQVHSATGTQTIRVLVPCEDEQALAEMERHTRSNCVHPIGWDITYERCSSKDRLDVYNDMFVTPQLGIVIVMQRNLRPCNPHIFLEVAVALEHCELLGCAGATAWRQKEWSLDLPEHKAWGLLRPSPQALEMIELQIAGRDRRKIVTEAVVLDGKFLAFRPSAIVGVAFDDELADSQSLAEEDWSNRVHCAGHRVSVHRNLGLLISESLTSYFSHSTQGQRRLLERLKLDPLALSVRDYTTISVPVKSAQECVEIANRFLI
jgi:predicted O-linked N-acetylglucosamine transferase (SPINDLY family)